MKLQVVHRTRFAYRTPVRDSFSEARLQPMETKFQAVHSFALNVSPPTQLKHHRDFYQNHVHRFDVLGVHRELSVEAVSVVATSTPPDPEVFAAPVQLSSMGECVSMDRCYDFLQPSAYVGTGEEITAFAARIVGARTEVWPSVMAIAEFIHGEFRYQPAVTNVHTRMAEVLRLRQGVCQDFAHVMLGLCRSLKIPARYVSGYLYNGPADQLRGAQASHAWVEVFLPGQDWIGVDPTNRQRTNERHVRLAVGRDYSDVSPVRGTYRGTPDRSLHVEVLVTRLEDDPIFSQSQIQRRPSPSLPSYGS